MNIGAYFSETKPESGGGFTFQEELLKALLRQAVNAPQNIFYVIATSDDLEKYILKFNPSKNLKFLLLDKSNILDRAIEWLKRSSMCLARIFKYEGPLQKLAKKNKLDLVWFMGGGCFETIDTPYIATVYDLQHRLQPWFPEVSSDGIWAGREMYHRYFLSRASYVIVGTESGRDEVELFYQIPKFRIYKLPHPTPSFLSIDDNKDKLDVNKKYNIPKNYIFYPAQFWPHKNHVNLLYAIKIIHKKYQIELSLVFTGSDKGNKKYVKEVVGSLYLSKQVYFLDFVPQSDLHALYSNASMLAYVSLCGPENLPPLEAFTAKCPVLASNVSGSEEQFGNSVLFCDPKNPNDIADKIYELYSNEELKVNLIKNGQQRALAWTPDNFVNGVFKIINEFSTIRINWS
jgi:glycosyltransferase involved in cell wall biosynthesis